MKKYVLVLVVLGLLFYAAAGIASVHGLFEGYPIAKIEVDGKEVAGDVPAVILSGRTMVPVRFVSEALGANVEWDPQRYTVVIATDKDEPAAVPPPEPPAPPPEPEPVAPEDQVSLLSSHDYWERDWYYMVGELKNNTNETVRFVRVELRGYQDGNLTFTNHTYASPSDITPGMTSSFKFMIRKSDAERFDTTRLVWTWR